MSLSNLGPGGFQSPLWRWLIERVWRLEHAFERSRAAAKPEDDTRIRIFLVMGFFGLCFVGVGLGAGWAALFSNAGKGTNVRAYLAKGAHGTRYRLLDVVKIDQSGRIDVAFKARKGNYRLKLAYRGSRFLDAGTIVQTLHLHN